MTKSTHFKHHKTK